MATERRLTMHNGRKHRGGKTFSSKHNDHSEENGKWDKEKSKDNWLWQSKNAQGKTFDEGEKAFYKKFLQPSLDEQNAKHIANRHYKRVKDIDQFRKSSRYCPEETIYYFGDKENQIEEELMKQAIQKFLNWRKKEFPQCQILNIALHCDEEGASHLQERHVWMAKDENGAWTVNQNKSLEQMGVLAPEPDKEINGTNNAKMTYTKRCREKLFEICKEMGIELVTEPRPKKESGKSLGEYIADKEKKELEKAKALVEELKAKNEEDAVLFESEKAILSDFKSDLIKSATQEFKGDLGGKLKATSVIRECFNRVMAKLGFIKERVDARTEKIQKVEPTYTKDLELPEMDEMEL